MEGLRDRDRGGAECETIPSVTELAEQKENLQDQMQSQRDEHRKRELRLRNEMDVLKEELETLSVAQGKVRQSRS